MKSIIYLSSLLFMLWSLPAQATDGRVDQKDKQKDKGDKTQHQEAAQPGPQKKQKTESTEASSFKPLERNVTSEVLLNFTGSANTTELADTARIFLGNVVHGLRLRLFMRDQLAIRMGIHLSHLAQKEIFYEEGGGTGVGEYTRSATRIGIAPGIEKHLRGTDRVSPYLGIELPFNIRGATETWVEYNGEGYEEDANREVTGAWADGRYRGGIDIGLNFVMGGDIYFFEWAYIGIEVGWGFLYSTFETVETKIGNTITLDTSGPDTFYITPNFKGGLRLGVVY